MKEYKRAGLNHAELYGEKGFVEWGVYNWLMRRARGHETRTRWDKLTQRMWKEWVAQWGITRKVKARGEGERAEGENALNRGEREKGRRGILLVCFVETQRAAGERAKYGLAVLRCTCGYVPERQHPGGARAQGPVLEMHKGGGAGAVASPENDGVGLPDCDRAHYGRPGTVVGTSATAAKGDA